jgi:hypothetical protein
MRATGRIGPNVITPAIAKAPKTSRSSARSFSPIVLKRAYRCERPALTVQNNFEMPDRRWCL